LLVKKKNQRCKFISEALVGIIITNRKEKNFFSCCSIYRYHYWLLYRLPEFPDPEAPPGNQLIAPVGKFPFRLHLELFFFLSGREKFQMRVEDISRVWD
jgi:hypothetical protein